MSTPQCTWVFCSPVGLKQTCCRNAHGILVAPQHQQNRYSRSLTVSVGHVQSPDPTAPDSGHVHKEHNRSAALQLPHPRIPAPHKYNFRYHKSQYVLRMCWCLRNSPRQSGGISYSTQLATSATTPDPTPPHRPVPQPTGHNIPYPTTTAPTLNPSGRYEHWGVFIKHAS